MGGDVYADPPEKAREDADRAEDTHLAGSGGVADVQIPRTHQHRNIDTRGGWGGSCAAGSVVVGLKWLSNQENGVVVGAVKLFFSCEGKHVWKLRAPGRLE